MLKTRMPEAVMESVAMKSLWEETVLICLVLNDIYSVQKELVSLTPAPLSRVPFIPLDMADFVG